MPKNPHQKLKLLYLSRIFQEETDENHPLTLPELSARLERFGISADRKTLYGDIEALRFFGLDIIKDAHDRNVYYYLGLRDFELPELKLLVDSVQSAKFVTERKSRELIKKLESLTSVHQAQQLQRSVYIAGRVKTMNERIYYSVDKLHTAISRNSRICFRYFQWNVKKEPELRHNGRWYHISPWALLWEDEYYYLVGYDHDSEMLRHYRVDKMLSLKLLDQPREGEELFRQLDLARYSQSVFGMFRTEECDVTLLCENGMAGAILDRFGKEQALIPADDTHFTVRIRVAPSEQFLGWVIGLGRSVKILAPERVLEQMRQEIARLTEQYND